MSRPPSADSILRNHKAQQRSFAPSQPIMGDFHLPNHSGMSNHPEFKKRKIRIETNNYTITSVDDTILLNGISNTVTASLPKASDLPGFIFYIKSINDSNLTDVNPFGTEEIDGDSANFILTKDQVITIQSDGSNWWII